MVEKSKGSLIRSSIPVRLRESLAIILTKTGDSVVNLRESVVEHRIKYSLSAMDDRDRQVWLDRALKSVSLAFCVVTYVLMGLAGAILRSDRFRKLH